MNYSCAKFGDCIFSRIGFIMRTDIHAESQNDTHTHTHTHTHSQNRMIATHATPVGVSNEPDEHKKSEKSARVRKKQSGGDRLSTMRSINGQDNF